ncbi:MCE family protein [Nocardia sp. NBC_01503]|uniref:MlaD family protein n=1 Tax=Nocardia sp. NBC_01503 TaxID=2975997 RepID=UPI002E7BCBEF|nr:MCE family protein [Nocardia sp. NBC_01503]WTL31551.1 MCE family protein [Nocardia sp. NBC_01503]
MGNTFELDGRGPSTAALLLTGTAFTLVCALCAWLLIAKSNGSLDERVRVTAELSSVGDGLPKKSDVKFRGVLVGMVRLVTPARDGTPNIVHIDLKAEYARDIPNTVTARIVPANAFAVSSVQLVDNGDAPALRDGSRIAEDRTLPTQLFQGTLAKVHELLAAVARPGAAQTLGLIRTLSDATVGQGPELTAAVDGLNRVTAEMNSLSAGDTGPSTLRTWETAIATLRGSAPELVDALHDAVAPMRTVAEQQAQLVRLLAGAHTTLGTVNTAIDNHIDQLVDITTDITPVIGVLADNHAKYPAVMVRLNDTVDKFFDELWTRSGSKLAFTFRLVVSLTPLRLYVRADCPVYGELRGPSCDSAPETTPIPETTGIPDMRNYVPPPGTVALPALPPAANPADRILLGPLGMPALPPSFAPSDGGR